MAKEPADGMRGRPGSGEREVLEQPPERRQLRTGNEALDLVLGGGIPRDAVYVLTGPPGAGKTILAQQISFAAAKAGLHVVYFTNVSEPHSKIVVGAGGSSDPRYP